MAKATNSELFQGGTPKPAHTSSIPPSSKPLNPFSIESILKSESTPPLPHPNSEEETPTISTLFQQLNTHKALLVYQTQLHYYARWLLLNRFLQQNQQSTVPVVPLHTHLLTRPVESSGNVIPNRIETNPVQSPAPLKRKISSLNATFKISQSKDKVRLQQSMIDPSNEKKIKIELVNEEADSIKGRGIITDAFPILRNNNQILQLSDVGISSVHSVLETAYNHELRERAKTKKAKEKYRVRKRNEEQTINEEVFSLNQQKNRLVGEKERLVNDISHLKRDVDISAPQTN